MAKVSHPFLSIEARGSLGGVLTAFKHIGQSHIIKKNTRRGLFVGAFSGFGRIYFGRSFFGFQGRFNSRTKSQEQEAQRIIFKNAWLAWRLLSDSEKLQYKIDAKKMHMTGPNLFMSQFYCQ